MSIAASQSIFRELREMGLNVLVPDYPGYAMSEGVATEAALYETSRAAFRYLAQRTDVDPHRIVAIGLSMGAAVAVDLAQAEPVAGLAIVVPFTRTADVGQDTMPWYARWAVPLLAPHVAFDNVAKIGRVSCPILLIEATRDELTSARRFEQLAGAIRAPLTRVTVDADHNGAWSKGLVSLGSWLEHLPRN